MRLTFLGKDSKPDESPTLYATDKDTYIVQGWIVTDSEVLAKLDLPEGETVVEVPPGLFAHLVNDGVEGRLTSWTAPIVHVTGGGNSSFRAREWPAPKHAARWKSQITKTVWKSPSRR
ncbi:hypothetical protein OHR68_34660 [Spirillospora sp. NBC_00431]